MHHSEGIGKLAEALAKAQSQFENAVKDSENPFFKSNYADLTSVFEACRSQLAENGLSVAQPFGFAEDGIPIVYTILMHTSGEWIRGHIKMKPTKMDPQGIGSALTYARRYSLESMLGIAREDADDDGNEASKEEKKKPSAPVKHPPSSGADEGVGDSQSPLPIPEEDETALQEHLFRLCEQIGKDKQMHWQTVLKELTENKDGKYGKTKVTEVPLEMPKKGGGTWSPLKAAISKAEGYLNDLQAMDEDDIPY